MDDMSESLGSLETTFELRFKEAWRLWRTGDNDAAETVAKDLLLEPRLGIFYRAGMHTLLSTSSNNCVEHGREAVHLYTVILERNYLTEDERNDIIIYLEDAMILLDKALHDQAGINNQIQETFAGGMTIEELYDAQIEDMYRRLDAEEAGIEDHPDGQSVPDMTGESQLSTQPTVSLRTDNTDTSVDTVL